MKRTGKSLFGICAGLTVAASLLCAGPEVNYPDLRIATEGEGMFYVSASELALVIGTTTPEVQGVLSTGTVKLSNGGSEAARMIAPGGAGMYFYGQKVDTPYADRNAYFITWESGLDMNAAGGSAPAYSEGGTYRHSAAYEQDNFAVTGATGDENSDFYVWTYFVADDVDIGTNDYEVVLNGTADGGNQAVLDIRLLGYTSTGVTDEHHARISVNGNVIGDVNWDGRNEKTNSIAFDSSYLVEGTNTIRIAAMLDMGAPDSQFYLDSMAMTYDRAFSALSDQLTINTATNGVVTINDFTGSNIHVADISVPLTPELLAAVTVDATNSAFAASFTPSNSATPYIAFEAGAGLMADEIDTLSSDDLASSTNDAEYVIITVPDMMEAAQALADHRQGQRLNTRVVLLQDIYDQFNDGIASPHAIRDFASNAYSNWVYSLRYMLLAGAGTYDYKGAGGGADQHVPTMLVGRESGLTASDTWFGDVDGDWAPDVAVGRLPAVTAEDMTNMVQRIIAHEGAAGNAWRQTIIMCADNPDGGGNFHVSSEDVSSIVPGEYTQEKILMASGAAAAASNQLRNAINSGALFMNYFGHSGIPNLSHESIFSSGDVAGLTNTNRLPIVTSMSCVMGRYEIPSYDCLGEAMILGGNGGAIAVFAPSSRAMNRDSQLLCKEFYKKMLGNDYWVLGDAVKAAMGAYAFRNRNRDILKFYNLMGDPALYIAETGAPTDDPFGPVLPAVVQWKTNYYNSAELDDPTVSGDFSDSDEDGITALAEYAFGLNPTARQVSSFVEVKKSEVVLAQEYDVVLEFKRRKGMTGIGIDIQVTSDFSAWRENDLDIVHTQVYDTGDGITETVKHFLKAPVDVDRLFITMTVEKLK